MTGTIKFHTYIILLRTQTCIALVIFTQQRRILPLKTKIFAISCCFSENFAKLYFVLERPFLRRILDASHPSKPI